MPRMKRKRSSGLRGTPAEHAQEMGNSLRQADAYAHEIGVAAKKGDCSLGVSTLLGGRRVLGMAEAHYRELLSHGRKTSGGSSAEIAADFNKVAKNLASAERGYIAACVVERKSGMSGLGRRPTRRKARR